MSAKPDPKRSFFAELKRRNVYKVGAMYCVAGWLLVQIVTQAIKGARLHLLLSVG